MKIISKPLSDWLRDSLRSRMLFGRHDEPLDDYGQRVVRAILVELEVIEASQGEALTQAQATIARMMTEADEDAASWQTQKARADKAEAANIVLQAEAEVGQQVRELVTAISRDGETVVGAVQRLIAEGEQARSEIHRLQVARVGDSEIVGRWMCQADKAEAEQAGLRAQVQALRDFTDGVMITFRNYYAQAIPRSKVEERIEGWISVRRQTDALLSSVSLPQLQEKTDDLSRGDTTDG